MPEKAKKIIIFASIACAAVLIVIFVVSRLKKAEDQAHERTLVQDRIDGELLDYMQRLENHLNSSLEPVSDVPAPSRATDQIISDDLRARIEGVFPAEAEAEIQGIMDNRVSEENREAAALAVELLKEATIIDIASILEDIHGGNIGKAAGAEQIAASIEDYYSWSKDLISAYEN